jgi:hypothetical protein
MKGLLNHAGLCPLAHQLLTKPIFHEGSKRSNLTAKENVMLLIILIILLLLFGFGGYRLGPGIGYYGGGGISLIILIVIILLLLKVI